MRASTRNKHALPHTPPHAPFCPHILKAKGYVPDVSPVTNTAPRRHPQTRPGLRTQHTTYRMKKTTLLYCAATLLCCACGNSDSKNALPDFTDGGYPTQQGVSTDQQGVSAGQQAMYACPMCGGTGVFELMPGDALSPRQVCQGCGGNKVVTAEQAQALANAQAQVNAMMGGGGNGGYAPAPSGRSAYEIELDLRKAYELLASMQSEYENCTSVVAQSQYPQMIAEQREYIQRLEAELRNAR